MWVMATFAANSVLGFVSGLVVAGLLGPEEYGRFAVGSMAAIVIATLAFDWLRLSTTRFYTADARGGEPDLRASLDAGYAGMALIVGAGAALVGTIGFGPAPAALVVGGVAAAAIANGCFDYSAARARALFDQSNYVRLVVWKNVGALLVGAGAAAATGRAEWVLATLALGPIAAVLTTRGRDGAGLAGLRGANRPRLLGFARYGLPIVGANLVYQAIVLANRTVAGTALGFAAAGQLSLATDTTIRLLLAAGAALDVHLFQLVVRRDAQDGEAAGEAQAARNMTVVTAFLVLLAVGYAATLPALEALVVPARFRGEFGRISLLLLPGVLAFCLVQFALSPIFQIARRTGPVLWAALAAGAVDLAALAVLPVREPGDLAAIHAAALLAGFLVVLPLARQSPGCWPPLRDLASVGLAGALTLAALWPTRSIGSPPLALAAAAGGVPLYAALLVALDVLGLRGPARSFLKRHVQAIGIRLAARA